MPDARAYVVEWMNALLDSNDGVNSHRERISPNLLILKEKAPVSVHAERKFIGTGFLRDLPGFQSSGFCYSLSRNPMSSLVSVPPSSADRSNDETIARMSLEVPHWYAVHTSAQREKKVANYLLQSGVEQFLPVYQNRRRWKDRVVTIETPLFSGYVFVRISLLEKLRVLNAPGVARFVSQNGKPAVIPEEDIERVKSGLVKGAIPHPYLTVGRRVTVVRGPLAGTSGILVRKKNNLRVVVCIDSIAQAMAIEVSGADVQPSR